MLSRRRFLTTTTAGVGVAMVSACRHPKAKGFPGYAFVANHDGGAVAAVDLQVFAVAKHIPVEGAPSAVLANARNRRVYALTPENGLVHELLPDTLALGRRARVGSAAIDMRLAPDGKSLYVLCQKPRQLSCVSLDSMAASWSVSLPADPAHFDISPNGAVAAVSFQGQSSVAFVDLTQRQVHPAQGADGEIGQVRFQPNHGDAARAQSDSRQLIAANLSRRALSFFDVEQRRLIVNLPLSVRPDHLCFKADGGELFVTGEGSDVVVMVSPYYTPQVEETVLAGQKPGAMAVSSNPGYLFVTNPDSANISVLDIETRSVLAVTPVGTQPSSIIVTPDDQYALVLNQTSGDMGIIRIPNLTQMATDQRRWKKGALFMLIPVGSRPVSAAVIPV